MLPQYFLFLPTGIEYKTTNTNLKEYGTKCFHIMQRHDSIPQSHKATLLKYIIKL